MKTADPIANSPEILAPAGGREAFLAAIAAGADAVYCGLKHFSARMAAQNFSLEELARVTAMAHERKVKVYVAFNSLVRPDEIDRAGSLIAALSRSVRPDALIVQDLALISLAKQARFAGEIHLSTLANAGFPAALQLTGESLGVHRVVVPRELSIDEIKQMARACPPGVALEAFVHGALCYSVSGRCYWSSYLGGRSGLRGRCVQPCRRLYAHEGQTRRYFSCQDLSLDVLVKVLAQVPQVVAWKIEGRKKSAHYVYHTVKAYRLLRDSGSDPDHRADARKEALDLLAIALGRTANHFRFLPQRPWHPVQTGRQTGSGFLLGKVQGASRAPYLATREALMAGDILRVGYEDDSWHATVKVKRFVPARGRLHLKALNGPQTGSQIPVFLIDRRSGDLASVLDRLSRELDALPAAPLPRESFTVSMPRRRPSRGPIAEMAVGRVPGRSAGSRQSGLWLSPEALARTRRAQMATTWWWLPPVLWPENQAAIAGLIDNSRKNGGRNFVINAPWQAALFESQQKVTLWAGPFCNLANPMALEAVAGLGVAGAVISPELGREDALKLPALSPLPLGIVLAGSWPLCISRILADDAKTDTRMASPRGEGNWVRQYGSDYWVYPDWQVDLTAKKQELVRAGYRLFISLVEVPPRGVRFKLRPGLWNWSVDLR